jgi:oligopeptide/dipeptide ABC transporter ATP-binding protein
VGESGCGKSVTMKAILRIVEPPGRIVSGEILLRRPSKGDKPAEVIDLCKLDPKGKEMRSIRGGEIALIPQEPMAAFSPVHTIGDQIIEAIRLHRDVSEREARQMACQLLRDVGIPMPEQRLGDYSWQLSGGLRQRAIIAMALSCNPRLLIADEPTTAVDVTTQAQVLRLLRRLQEERNAAIIFIKGPVDDIFHNPKHPYTKALLESIPSITMAPRIALPTISGSIPHPFNRPKGCPFHPRCTRAIPGTCDTQQPALQAVGDGQLVSCFLYQNSNSLHAEVVA